MEPGIEEGTLLDDRYRVGRKIGEGGMGAVFEGENTILHRPVAIKALRPHLALDSEAMARFQREAELTSSLNHPHIVAVLDMNFRTPPYIVMELLEGESLRARLVREGRVAQTRCLVIATQLLSALAESHERGILHRDVKPANVFLATNAAVGVSAKLLDFGIAKLTQSKAGIKRITQPSHIVGSGAYMSPEQIMAQPLGPETDIFSVGVLLYEALSGKKPFVGEDVTMTMARIVAGEPPPPIEGVLPPLMKIILRALAREPSQRFASAREMSKALEPLLPRFSAMNLRSPLVMEDRTEPIASSAVRTERTGPPSHMAGAEGRRPSSRPPKPGTIPMIRQTSDPPAPPVQVAAPFAVTLPIAAVVPRIESRPAPAQPVAAVAPVVEEVVVPLRTSRVPGVVLVGGLLLLGVGLVLYGALQRSATYAPQARAGKMEWRNARASATATGTFVPGEPSGLVPGRALAPAVRPSPSSTTAAQPAATASSPYGRFD